jgi:hypothetical protein
MPVTSEDLRSVYEQDQPVVLYRMKLGLSSVVKHRLGVFENRVVTTIFGPQRKDANDWRTRRCEQLHGLH